MLGVREVSFPHIPHQDSLIGSSALSAVTGNRSVRNQG